VPDEQTDEPAVTGGSVPAAPDEARTPAEPTADAVAGADAGFVVRGEAGTHDDGEVADDGALPDEATLARIASPVLVRRAPRYGAFIGYGAVLGFVVGVVFAIALDRGDLVAAGEGGGVLPFLAGSNGARLVTGVALAGVGAVAGALLALWADARSRRHVR
jgi:hypothetical protein